MTSETSSFVRFVPSRVEGLAGVAEVAVSTTRFSLKTPDGWVNFEFAAFATAESRSHPALRLWLRLRPAPATVGELYFVRANYADSFIRFHSDPPITIYMPADGGPATYPNSVFWRIQQTVRSGGYRVADYKPADAHRKPMPRHARITGGTFLAIGILNALLMAATGIYLGGHAGSGKIEHGRYYVASHGHYTEVSPTAWTFSRRQEISQLFTFPLLFAGFFLRYGFPPRRGRDTTAPTNPAG